MLRLARDWPVDPSRGYVHEAVYLVASQMIISRPLPMPVLACIFVARVERPRRLEQLDSIAMQLARARAPDEIERYSVRLHTHSTIIIADHSTPSPDQAACSWAFELGGAGRVTYFVVVMVHGDRETRYLVYLLW